MPHQAWPVGLHSACTRHATSYTSVPFSEVVRGELCCLLGFFFFFMCILCMGSWTAQRLLVTLDVPGMHSGTAAGQRAVTLSCLPFCWQPDGNAYAPPLLSPPVRMYVLLRARTSTGPLSCLQTCTDTGPLPCMHGHGAPAVHAQAQDPCHACNNPSCDGPAAKQAGRHAPRLAW